MRSSMRAGQSGGGGGIRDPKEISKYASPYELLKYAASGARSSFAGSDLLLQYYATSFPAAEPPSNNKKSLAVNGMKAARSIACSLAIAPPAVMAALNVQNALLDRLDPRYKGARWRWNMTGWRPAIRAGLAGKGGLFAAFYAWKDLFGEDTYFSAAVFAGCVEAGMRVGPTFKQQMQKLTKQGRAKVNGNIWSAERLKRVGPSFLAYCISSTVVTLALYDFMYPKIDRLFESWGLHNEFLKKATATIVPALAAQPPAVYFQGLATTAMNNIIEGVPCRQNTARPGFKGLWRGAAMSVRDPRFYTLVGMVGLVKMVPWENYGLRWLWKYIETLAMLSGKPRLDCAMLRLSDASFFHRPRQLEPGEDLHQELRIICDL